ncbi:putative chromosome segregation protein [Vibrio phage vB_VcorM_GR7B]|nr:putative chromosome segregation protein [Vibrio phage vB_VcorM_GR7B]
MAKTKNKSKAKTNRKAIIVAGGRKFGNYKLACKEIRKFAKKLGVPLDNLEIVCGMALGADNMGRCFAMEFLDGRVVEMPADWKNLDAKPCLIKYNKYEEPYNALAGTNRNEDMANVPNVVGCLCFWDGKSPGTQDMMTRAVKRRRTMQLKVVYYDKKFKKCKPPKSGKPKKSLFSKSGRSQKHIR